LRDFARLDVTIGFMAGGFAGSLISCSILSNATNSISRDVILRMRLRRRFVISIL